jgi:hypothetical protein
MRQYDIKINGVTRRIHAGTPGLAVYMRGNKIYEV